MKIEKQPAQRSKPYPKSGRKPTPQKIVPSNSLIASGSSKDLVIRERIKTFWGLKSSGPEYNPSPNPVSIRRDELSALKNDDYVVTEKSDGCRYMLVLTKNEDKSNVAIMMDRACCKYEIRIYSKPAYFEGTVFDGELVWETDLVGQQEVKRLVYWVFDIVSVAGVSVREKSYPERYNILHKLISDPDKYEIKDPQAEEDYCQKLASSNKIVAIQNGHYLCFRPKPCFRLNNIEALWTSRKKLKHSSDGLIFIPINEPVRTGTHFGMFKYKMDHTIDMRLQLTEKDNNWQVGLYYGEDRGLEKGRVVDVLPSVDASQGFDYFGNKLYFKLHRDEIVEKMIAKLKTANVKEFSCIIECSIKFGGANKESELVCFIKKIRTDKTVPNNYRTIQQTILNAQESIGFEELKATINSNLSSQAEGNGGEVSLLL